MLDLETGRRVILRELDGMIQKLEACADNDWARPVRCEGWTIGDLALHVHGYPSFMTDILERMKEGVTEPPTRTPAPVPPPRPQLLEALRSGREKLGPVLSSLTPESLGNMAPMPFATLPGFVALQIAAVEAGLHHNDLEWALGREVPLPEDVADAVLTTVPGMLTMLAGGAPKPESPLAYKLSSPSSTMTVLSRDGEWQQGEDAAVPPCEISGDDSAVALFVLGRIPANDPSLKTSDPLAAARFKTYFPGP